MLGSLNFIELQSFDFQILGIVNFACFEALMNGFFQVAIILDWLVKVGYCPLEYIFDDSFDDDMFFGGEFRMIEISNSF